MPRFEHHWVHGHMWGGGFFWGPEMFLSALIALFWLALLIGLVWAIAGLLLPAMRPTIKDLFGSKSRDVSALEILRRRYAAGEIDSFTFEQMWERLIASYQQERYGRPLDAGYQESVMHYSKDVSHLSF